MRNPQQQARTEEELAHVIAEFLNRESNRQSLVTVTRVSLNDARTILTAYVSVFPDSEGEHALEFLERQRDAAHEYVRAHTRPQRSLGIRFELDRGEENRRRIDELSKEG
jgi:ribosome-binding factor A